MNDIEVIELKAKRDSGEDILLIDVRENFEFAMYNIGGILIPLSTLPSKIESLEQHINKEIVLLCRSGMRSASAKQLLESAGFGRVRNLVGGVLAWQEAGFLPNGK